MFINNNISTLNLILEMVESNCVLLQYVCVWEKKQRYTNSKICPNQVLHFQTSYCM